MKVFIADDSIVIRNIIKEILATQSGFEVAGEASNGELAVQRVLETGPDIVIMDMDMPVMNGLEATCRITSRSPVPVLMFTNNTDPELPFKALRQGAAEFLRKPDFHDINRPEYISRFVDTLRTISKRYRGRIVYNRDGDQDSFCDSLKAQSGNAGTPTQGKALYSPEQPLRKIDIGVPPSAVELPPDLAGMRPQLVVLGASTGGPQAILHFLLGLKCRLPVPLVLVQHIETGFDRGFAEWLKDESGQVVSLARDGAQIQPGQIYVAPTDYHLRFDSSRLYLDNGPKVLNQKPSVDVLFSSAAENFGSGVLGVLLTGMGQDGASGCLSLLRRGGKTLVQDESTSLIYGMPRAAVECGGASHVLPLPAISQYVSAIAGSVQ